MDIFDERIIGYSSVKETVRKVVDGLKRSEDYKSKGIELPHGMLLEGPPGTGKSTMAQCLAKASERYTVTFRKNKEGNEFLEDLSKTFAEALENSPSVIVLEDIHQYSDSSYGSEWAALQTGMDSCKGADVFVIATTNTTNYISESLLRPGRFDYILSMDILRGRTAKDIITHYLKGKNLSQDIDLEDISKVLDGRSCAMLETAINIAAANAVYDHSEVIEKRHLTSALMQVVHKAGMSDKEYTAEEMKAIAVHEASHAVVSEVLRHGSVSVVSILSANNGIAGITDYCGEGYSNEEDLMNLIMVALAGKAGVEVILGGFDIGTEEDIEKAYKLAAIWATTYAGGGFGSVEARCYMVSELNKSRHEQLIASKLEQLYARTKQIVFNHREKIECLSAELLEKKVLFSSDIMSVMGEE